MHGRTSLDSYVLTPEQIEAFHKDGCVTLPNVLTEEEVSGIEKVFDRFLNREIHVPGKDFCDMSKPFGIPFEDWSIVNCMLPTTYHPQFKNNIFERLTANIVKQIHPNLEMAKDYDQLLNKRPGKKDAVFPWHQDMGYWPGPKALGVDETSTCTFSLAIDDSTEKNGCLCYVPGSGLARKLRQHAPLSGSRDEGHALTIDVDESKGDVITLAQCMRGSVTVHDEFVVHGSGGNMSLDRQRRTYVLAYRPKKVVDAERKLGFTHSHNDEVNWDTFDDGENRSKK
mmetsp:Transcript_34777/g.84019  ORF Transcript_34777/g.84019 Transcript_34777/m.84019 type:complete len:283 (+) Transcript_34777:112-960(+)